MDLVVIIAFVVSFFITFAFIPLVRKIALKINFIDAPGERKVHTTPIPLGGGIAIFLGISLTFILAVLGAYWLRNYPASGGLDSALVPKQIFEYIPGVFQMLPRLLIIFGGAAAIFILGIFDDIKKFSAPIKFFFEIIICICIIASGISFSLFMEPFGFWGELVSAAVTLFWMILVINSFNLLDHMDGLSSGIAAITSIIFLAIALGTKQYFIACFLITIIGSCFAFLIFNFHPAKIFMGDAGSLLLGYFIAVLTVLFTFYKEHSSYYPLLTPLLVVAIPVFDTLIVVVIRYKRKKPLFRGDKNHVAHRLISLGMKIPQAVIFIYALTLCAGLSAILLYCLNDDPLVNTIGALFIFGQVVLLLAIVTILEYTARKNMALTEDRYVPRMDSLSLPREKANNGNKDANKT